MKILYLFFIFIISSCIHGQLEIQSFPNNAELSVIEQDGSIKKIGKTPISINQDAIFDNNNLIRLQFSKDGFREENIYFYKPDTKSRVKISTKLTEASSAKEIISNEKLEKISSRIAEAQKHSFSKRYKRAEEILSKLIEEYPSVSVPYDLLANIYYISNDKERALYFYNRANEISPGNSQREFLINKINQDIKNDSGASL